MGQNNALAEYDAEAVFRALDIEQVGEFSRDVINLLGLSVEPGTGIYLSTSNRVHMVKRHERDYRKYISRLSWILAYPDYVGKRHDGSIEYIKSIDEYVKIAVRVAGDGVFYTRSLYHVDSVEAVKKIKMRKWKRLRVDNKK